MEQQTKNKDGKIGKSQRPKSCELIKQRLKHDGKTEKQILTPVHLQIKSPKSQTSSFYQNLTKIQYQDFQDDPRILDLTQKLNNKIQYLVSQTQKYKQIDAQCKAIQKKKQQLLCNTTLLLKNNITNQNNQQIKQAVSKNFKNIQELSIQLQAKLKIAEPKKRRQLEFQITLLQFQISQQIYHIRRQEMEKYIRQGQPPYNIAQSSVQKQNLNLNNNKPTLSYVHMYFTKCQSDILQKDNIGKWQSTNKEAKRYQEIYQQIKMLQNDLTQLQNSREDIKKRIYDTQQQIKRKKQKIPQSNSDESERKQFCKEFIKIFQSNLNFQINYLQFTETQIKYKRQKLTKLQADRKKQYLDQLTGDDLNKPYDINYIRYMKYRANKRLSDENQSTSQTDERRNFCNLN